jgi:hypothetical protein
MQHPSKTFSPYCLHRNFAEGGDWKKRGHRRETDGKEEKQKGGTDRKHMWNETGDVVKMSKEGKIERVKTKSKNQ